MFKFCQPLVMGILNVTPDSFSDGGQFLDPEKAFLRAKTLYEQGADVIDIGGESTRPGAKAISTAEELDRVIPVLEKIKHNLPVRISVDTVKPDVMKEALKQGIWMINDTHALQSPGALQLLAQSDCQICLMHKQGEPLTMQVRPHYEDVTQEVHHFFQERVQAANEVGISSSRLWLDPGIGFGKATQHNLLLLKQIQSFYSLNLPVMVGISRKTILGDVIGQPVEARKDVGLAAAVYLLLQGVKMIRTHDVKGTKEAVLLLERLM